MYQGKLTDKLKIGKDGETVACVYLKKKGFKIIERNYQQKWGEVDIVSEKDNKIHFIEVKTVSHPKKGKGFSPEENVHLWKRQRLSKTIQTYLSEKNLSDTKEIQVDVICVFLDKETKKAQIEVIENIIL